MMAFDSFSAFLHMGKHGIYVWSAYGLTLLLLVSYSVYTHSMHRRLHKQLHMINTTENDHETGS